MEKVEQHEHAVHAFCVPETRDMSVGPEFLVCRCGAEVSLGKWWLAPVTGYDDGAAWAVRFAAGGGR